MRRYSPCRQGGCEGTPPEWPLSRGGEGSAGGRLASRGHPQPHWSARDCAGAGGRIEVGGAPAHLKVPQACCSRDTHSGLAASPPQPPPCAGPEGADVLNSSRWGGGRGVSRQGGGGAAVGQRRGSEGGQDLCYLLPPELPRTPGPLTLSVTAERKARMWGTGCVGLVFPWGGGCFLVPSGGQPTACTLALWWLKFGLTEIQGGGGGWCQGPGSPRP